MAWIRFEQSYESRGGQNCFWRNGPSLVAIEAVSRQARAARLTPFWCGPTLVLRCTLIAACAAELLLSPHCRLATWPLCVCFVVSGELVVLCAYFFSLSCHEGSGPS